MLTTLLRRAVPRTGTRSVGWRFLASALAVGLALVAAVPAPAAAHASLVSVDPPDGARLDQSPDVVTLTFSEAVSAELGGVRVLDGDGEQVQEGAARVDGATVVVGLTPDLPDGTYVISYRVISADGHPARGGSVFGVGDGPLDRDALGRVASTSGDRPWEVLGALGRWLAYGGALVAAGGALFLVRVRPDDGTRQMLVGRIRVAAAVGAGASLVALPVQAALGTGQGAGSLFDPGVLDDVAADGVGLALLLCLGGLAMVGLGVTRWTWLATAGAAVAATSFAATGHTRVGSSATPATVADATHLLAGAVWGGGLVALTWTLRARRRGGATVDPAATAGIVVRFSDLATLSILAVGVSGLALSWNEVRSLGALTDTRYGLFLLAKVAVVAAIAALGGYNHFRLVPSLRAGKPAAALSRLRQTVRLEALALIAVVGITSVLVVTTPARDRDAAGVVEEVVQVGSAGSVQLVVSPARAGFNEIHLYTFDPSGRPAEIAQELTVELTLPAAQLGPIEREATRAGPAHFQLSGSDLAVGGQWVITIRLRVDRFNEAAGTITVPVAG